MISITSRNCLFFLCFAFFTSFFGKFLLHLDVNKRTYNHVPGECGVIPNLPGILSLTTTTGGRLYLTVNSKDNSDTSTHLFTFYSDNRTAREIEVKGAPKKWKWQPGAISATTDSNRPHVFVMNEKTTNVEIFETDDQKDSWKFVKTIRNDKYEGLVDLSASGPNSFYFVKSSMLGSAFNLIERIFPIPTGEIVFSNGRMIQHVAYVSSPTGVVYDNLKKSLFVTSFSRKSILAMKIQNGHQGTSQREIDIGCSPSSIWRDFDGSFLVTCHEVRFRYLLHLSEITSTSPSMVLRVVISSDEEKDVTITQLYSNDGATISKATFAVRSGRSLLISEGVKILNCNL